MILGIKAAVASAPAAGLPYQWVATGTSGSLATSTSTTANSWTTQTSSFGATNVNGVASNATDLYVAVGDSGKIATSPDGVTWTQRTSGFSTTNIIAVAYFNGLWVATGSSGKIGTSPDGITWTQRTSGTASQLRAVAYGDGIWVTGGSTVLLTATDPTSTWTSRTSTLTDLNRNGIYYWPEGNIWVAGSDTVTTEGLASSSDGITWTARDSTFAAFTTCFTSTASVLVNSGSLGGSPVTWDVQSSTNGTSWTDRTPADNTASMWAAAVDDAGFMIIAGTKIQSSTDGSTWTDRGSTPFEIRYLCHSTGVPAIR